MGVIDGHKRNLKELEESIEDIAGDIVRRNADEIIRVIQDRQLGIGLYSDGQLLGTYSPATQEYADEEDAITEKPEGEPYNFQWTGETFSKMILKYDVAGMDYSIFTKKAKQELLRGIYGDDLFKLTEENNTWVNEKIIEPELIKYISERWFLSL